MPLSFLQYGLPEQADAQVRLRDRSLHHSASEQLYRVQVGDVTWIVTVREEELYVLGRIVVGVRTTTHEEARRERGTDNIYEAKHHIIAEKGTEEQINQLNLNDIAELLRFESRYDRLTIRAGQVNPQQLQSLRQVTSASGDLINRKWIESTSIPEKSDEEWVQATLRSGAGFGDPSTNKKVERAAIDYVTEWDQNSGWNVRSVEADEIGYDLHCTQGTLVEQVDVKGVSGVKLSFIITKGERNEAGTNPRCVICIVPSALSDLPHLARLTGRVFLDKFALVPIAFRARLDN